MSLNFGKIYSPDFNFLVYFCGKIVCCWFIPACSGHGKGNRMKKRLWLLQVRHPDRYEGRLNGAAISFCDG